MIVVKPLIVSILLMGIFGVAEVVSTKRGKGRRFQQTPVAPAYQNIAFPIPQPQIPSYHSFSSGYLAPPVLRQSPVRPVAPRPGIVVFGVGPNSLQIPNQYTNYGGAAPQTNRNVPRPAHYASPATVITKTATRVQSFATEYTQPAPYQQNIEQTRYESKSIQPVYPIQSSQYGNKLPVAQSENYQQPNGPTSFFQGPVTVPKLPNGIPIYISPAKSTVYASAYVSVKDSYQASNSYTGGEASKPVGLISAPYKSPAKQPQEVYQATPSTLYRSKTRESSKETKAEQSTQAYTKQSTKVKENQSYDSTPSPKVKYFTDDSYSSPEYKPTSVSYGAFSNPEEPNADKHQSKIPFLPASESYKEDESLSYGAKKVVDSSTFLDSKVEVRPSSQSYKLNAFKESTQEGSKVKSSVYPVTHSYKKEVSQDEKKEQVSDSVPNPPTKSEDKYAGESYQAHTQPEKSSANQYQQQNLAYPTMQSYKEVDSQPYGEQKKNADGSSYPYSKVAAKPVTKSSKQNAYQLSTEEKKEAALYPASQNYKEVEKSKDILNYKKKNLAVYEPTSINDSYVKNLDVRPHVKEVQPKVVPTSDSYKKVASLAKSEDQRHHYAPKHVSYKAATVLINQNYPSILAVTQESLKYHETDSETYKSKFPSVSPAPESPVKELNSYSKQAVAESSGYSLSAYSTTTSSTSYQYSTVSKTTTERSTTPAQNNLKVSYKTTPKYQESYSSLSVATPDNTDYKSTAASKNIPVATTPSQKENDYNQYSTKKYGNIKVDVPVAVETSYAIQTTTTKYNVEANDRVYVVADQDEIVESYNQKEPSVSNQSYQDPSKDEKSPSVKYGVDQYAPTYRDYSYASAGTTNNSNYNGGPAASPTTDLPTYSRKPITEADSVSTSEENTKHSSIYRNDGVEDGYSAIPGKPEVDYPIFSELPNDKFNCSEQRLPGYYADTSARCQVFHICLGDRQWSFLCPNGTIFSQQNFVCVWWYEFDCSKATSLYDLNEKLFIIPSKQQDSDYIGDQYVKPLASKILEKTGKQYETFLNRESKKETISGPY